MGEEKSDDGKEVGDVSGKGGAGEREGMGSERIRKGGEGERGERGKKERGKGFSNRTQ